MCVHYYESQLCLIVYWLKLFISRQVVESPLSFISNHYSFLLTISNAKHLNQSILKRGVHCCISFKDYLQTINSFALKVSFIPIYVMYFNWHHLSFLYNASCKCIIYHLLQNYKVHFFDYHEILMLFSA